MFLPYFFIQAILFVWHFTLALCSDDLRHCQKSGCRTSPDGKIRSSSVQARPNFATMRERTPTAQQPKDRLYTLAAEWIMVFLFLLIFSYIKSNGCQPICMGLQAVKSSIASSFDQACTSILYRVSSVRSRESRSARVPVSRVRQGRRSLASHGSTASLGSLADLIGWDEKSEPSVSSINYSSSSASTYTSIFSESESEATASRKRFPGDNVSSNRAASTNAVSSVKKAGYPTNSRLDTYSDSDTSAGYDSNDSYSTGYDTNDSYSAGYSSSGSVLSKFLDYLSVKSAEKKREVTSPGGNRGIRRSSVDDSGLRNTLDRPLYYASQKRRTTTDTLPHYKIGDHFLTAFPASSSIKSQPQPHGNKIESRHTPVSSVNDSSPSASTYTSNYIESESEATTSRKRFPRDNASSSPFLSSFTSKVAMAPSGASTTTVSSGKKAKYPRNSRLDTYNESDTGAGYDTNDSYSAGYSSSGPILSKLSVKSAKKNWEETSPRRK